MNQLKVGFTETNCDGNLYLLVGSKYSCTLTIKIQKKQIRQLTIKRSKQESENILQLSSASLATDEAFSRMIIERVGNVESRDRPGVNGMNRQSRTVLPYSS